MGKAPIIIAGVLILVVAIIAAIFIYKSQTSTNPNPSNTAGNSTPTGNGVTVTQSTTSATATSVVDGTTVSSSVTTGVADFGMCGGTGTGCKGNCADAQWATCSGSNSSCVRLSAAYRQCQPLGYVAQVVTQTLPAGCISMIQPYAACGGIGDTRPAGVAAVDAAWPGYCTSNGYTCTRKDATYWQSLPNALAGSSQ